ncbi:flagellar hook-associated protein FlgK [Jannaschia sp. S6380]|uniref:flagellar hook-associated protein FlgK n=1 Tax=Jannaschia sp. S6380 TaxID=2926408 RepID=UPI001FF19389|nr:flagellar hook-associated protein FlgK [Jannaschia sp. S6380]MCK0169058.1 flagellar hook-associated protein FlgK [Jannaschia sp. S6380]
MSLTSSLSFAAAGLDLNARRADVVARNVANAGEAGYARRTLDATGAGIGLPGSGVAVSRDVDPRLVQLRREAQSQEAATSVAAQFQTRLDAAIGDPDTAGSLQDRLARLDAAFVSAAASPGSETRLTEIAHAADATAEKLNSLDALVRQDRQDAETEIGRTVDKLNADLEEVARINAGIVRLDAGGHDTADLLDQRTRVLDRISQEVPIRELPRDNGAVALVTQGGVLLLDGRPAELGHDGRNPITPDMTAPDQLSGLTVNGRPVSTDGPQAGIAGGRLQALFELRDRVAPSATARLDGLAAELVGRFGHTSVDPTLAPADPGLFSDGGLGFDPSAPAGLAGRLQINAAVAPERTDQHWRLRDGLAASGSGVQGDPDLLLAYGAAFAETAAPRSSDLQNRVTNIAGHAAGLKSSVSADRVRLSDAAEAHRGQAQAILDARDGGAVDVDAEMRRLIEIEQAYAANARVIRVVDDMMNRLMEI